MSGSLSATYVVTFSVGQAHIRDRDGRCIWCLPIDAYEVIRGMTIEDVLNLPAMKGANGQPNTDKRQADTTKGSTE